jgi:hypothetical protein
MLTIVMYHYVRDLAASRYPGITGLDVRDFTSQLDYVQKHHEVITVQDLLGALQGESVPRNAALLTFDDGYIDHFENVFPVLQERGLQGLFFVPAGVVLDDRVLGVNKIHFILAAAPDDAQLFEEVLALIEGLRAEFDLEPTADYLARYHVRGRFDSPSIAFIKAVLQKGLPEPCRARIVDQQFQKFVCRDEADFARQLYMSLGHKRTVAHHAGCGHVHWSPRL